MKKILLGFALFLGAPVLAVAAEISVAELGTLPRADVVFLGEVHDNPGHHVNQATAVTLIEPKALVFEMLTAEQAGRYAPDLLGQPKELGSVLGWPGSGWPDFRYYVAIFQAAPRAQVFGANVPRARAKRAFKQGAAAVFGADAHIYRLDMPLPQSEQKEREDEQFAAHCDALPVSILPGMVQAQRLRDAAIAQTALKAFLATGGPVVVITGNGHARRDRGAPFLLQGAAPRLSVQSIGQLETRPTLPPAFSSYLVTQPAQREDPCAAFSQ